MNKLKVCWLSAGVSSFIAGYLVRDSVDVFIYIDVADQHPDSLRFISDCEKVLGKHINILSSSEYSCVEDTVRSFGFFRNVRSGFYPCTNVLKKRVRKQWENNHSNYEITYVWGFDVEEKYRAIRLLESMPEFNHEFPLIDRCLSKSDAHGICKELGIKRPAMYDLGYNNNNCIGCVKGGKGYWNKIRRDFPKVFSSRAVLEREVGYTILCDKGVPLYLDQLNPNSGRMNEEIMEDCNIYCMINLEV